MIDSSTRVCAGKYNYNLYGGLRTYMSMATKISVGRYILLRAMIINYMNMGKIQSYMDCIGTV